VVVDFVVCWVGVNMVCEFVMVVLSAVYVLFLVGNGE